VKYFVQDNISDVEALYSIILYSYYDMFYILRPMNELWNVNKFHSTGCFTTIVPRVRKWCRIKTVNTTLVLFLFMSIGCFRCTHKNINESINQMNLLVHFMSYSLSCLSQLFRMSAMVFNVQSSLPVASFQDAPVYKQQHSLFDTRIPLSFVLLSCRPSPA
jgi:hypothetical protein